MLSVCQFVCVSEIKLSIDCELVENGFVLKANLTMFKSMCTIVKCCLIQTDFKKLPAWSTNRWVTQIGHQLKTQC